MTQEGENRVIGWLNPALLAAIGLGSFAGYGQLTTLTEQVAETNRLSEMRGRNTAEIMTLKEEVAKLRVVVASMMTNDQAEKMHDQLRASISKLVGEVLKKVDTAVFLEQIREVTLLFKTVAQFQDRLVTQEQLNVVVGRIDAISRRFNEMQGVTSK